MRKVLLYLAIFFASGTLITVVSLTFVDNFIYSLGQTSAITTTQPSTSELKDGKKVELPADVDDIQYSFDNKYYTYLKDNKVYINNIEDGENVDIIEEENPICYYNLLYDKNLIIYFTEESGQYSSKLVLNTYEIANKKKNEYNNFTVKNFSKIKDMNMSPIINIIYINVETKSANSTNNVLYRIDLFNSMSQVKSGTIINKLIMLQHKDRIYYEDSKSNIYSSAGYISLFKNDVDMIGIDYDDNLYFIDKEEKKTVYKVNNNRIVDTIELSDSDLVTTYTNNYGVYLVYPTYVINVSGEDPYKRIGKFSKYVKFEAIKGNIMYLRTSNNILISTDLLEN